MSKPAKVILNKCVNYLLCENKISYTSKDILLYALGIGLSNNPVDIKDLTYTYENSYDFMPLPTFPVTFVKFNEVIQGLIDCPGLPEFNPMLLLHGEQKITLHKKLECTQELYQKSIIKNVYDKKNAAIVFIQVNVFDIDNNDLICVNDVLLFIKGIGGFGGTEKMSEKKDVFNITRSPDLIVTRETSLNQAIIYRLSGDMNPLHIDPDMASIGGFDRPILHGLCTFGIGSHAIVKELLDNDASNVFSIEGRFTNPVTPGDELNVEIWNEKNNKILFRIINNKTNKVCFNNGIMSIHSSSIMSKL